MGSNTSPVHRIIPPSNELAERAVQTLKNALKNSSRESLTTQINCFLFQYRLTPHSTTGITPTELLLGQRPRSQLDLLFPDIANRVRRRQLERKADHDRRSREREFGVGQAVWVKNYLRAQRLCQEPSILKVLSPWRFQVALSDRRVLDRHIHHVRLCVPTPETVNPSVTVINPPDLQEDETADPKVNPAALDPPAYPTVRPQLLPCRST